MINPFGYIFILVICFVFFRSRTSKELFINFLKFELLYSIFKLNYGFFIYIGDSEIQYGDIVLGVTFVTAMIRISFIELNRRLLISCFYLFCIIGTGRLILRFNPADVQTIDINSSWDLYLRGVTGEMKSVSFSFQSILMYIRVCFFIVIILIAKSSIATIEWIQILNFLTTAAKIILIFGLIEILIKYGLGYDLNEFLQIIFGRGMATGGDETRLQGFSREPSYYALALFNIIILFIVNIKLRNRPNEKLMWLIITVLIGLNASAYSFYLVIVSSITLAIGIFSTSVGRVNIKRFSLILILGMFFLFMFGTFSLTMNSYILYRTIDALKQISQASAGTYTIGVDFGSVASRLIGIIESFKSYTVRPIIGLGLGTVYCLSGLVSILANIGLIGFIIWIRLLTVSYFKLNLLLTISLLSPILLTNDLSSLYDTAYIAIIPFLFLAVNDLPKNYPDRKNEKNYNTN